MNISVITQVASEINWIWLAFAVMASFLVGALWYSLVFFNLWIKVFKLDKNNIMKSTDMVRSFLIQFIAGSFMGAMFFILSFLSLKFAVFALISICLWQMCALTFKYGSWRPFLEALLIEAGYTAIAGTIYILFALI